MNSDSPFTVHGDETLEARIVAWVLGEASAFEEAELERLCEERPELLVFRHRMRALHGLLTEAEKQQPDEGWKLPEEKRKLLDEIFGETKVVRLEAEKEKPVRHTGRRILLAIAASVVIGFVVLSSMPTKYESVATLEVRPRTPGMAPLTASNSELSGARSMTPQFFGTEFEIVKSRNNLEKVVDNLNLQSRWNVDKDAAVAKLKSLVDAENIKGTDLMSIRVRSTNKEDARDIAEAVTKEYKSYRESLERKNEEAQLAKLRKAVQAQEDKVEERRKVLSTIVRTKGIVYKGTDSFYNDGEIAQDQGAKNALQMYHQLEQEKIQLDSQINSLLKYDSDQLMTYASGLDLPDNIVKNLYPQYLEAKRQLEAQKINGLAENHPSAQAAADNVQRMEKQLNEGVVNLRETLKAKLDLTNDRFESVKTMKDDTRDDAIRRGLDAQDYVDAKRDFETDQELLQQMKLKLIGEDTSSEMQIETVKIHERPVEAKKVGPLQSIFGLFGNRESHPNAELADAKSVRFSTPAEPSAPALAQLESDGPVAKRSLDVAKPRAVPPIADAPADVLAMNEPQNDLRSNPGQPAPANKPAAVSAPEGAAEVTSLNSLSDRMERTRASATADAKDSEVFFAGKTPEGDALAGMAASAPQPATATPAASDAETDLVKLMSGGTITSNGGVGGGGGGIQEGFKSDAGVAYADGTFGFSTRRTGSDKIWSSNFSADGSDSEPDSDVDHYTDASQMPSLSAADQPLPEVQAATKGNLSWEIAENKNSDDAVLADPYGRTSVVAKPIRTNAAETSKHEQSVDAIRKNLYIAEGNYNLGKYDDAKKSYEDVLRADPYNAAARRGMEQVNQAKSDYYRAAYDHTRAELLSQVDSTWELAVPEDSSKVVVGRELQLPTESEPPELPNAETKAKEFPVTPATPAELKVQDEGLKVPLPKQQPAKPDLSKLIEEVASAEEPYSTFSLNISDASFQIAQAAMAKGGRPDPAGVKVEQFYNAVDYGDPAPAAGEPVAVNIEQSAHPVIPGRNLVRVALKTAAAGRAASQPLHLTLLVDQSGSMSREDRRTAMKQALNSLGGLLSNNDRVTVIGFSRTPHLLADGWSGDKSKNLADLVNLEASEGGTNLEEAMKLGGQLAERHKQAGAQNRIVLFTDGAANLGDADPEKLAERVKQLRQKGIAFDIAGIAAADLNDALLAELARNGNGRYYVVGKGDDENFAKQLAGAFRPAAENVKVQVHFNPERVSRYKLIGFEKDRLKTEDFRNDAVDAAEMAAEEAGVAIYQIEPIPGGKGEIGEVSVRFRDTTAGQMVERTWAITHDPSSPAFDRATPSMQLATFAMLAAEKLKGGAFAEAIDFKQFSAPQANVKQFYGDQGRPAEVLRMVDALK